MSEKHNEWHTPRIYVDAARDVMGTIDLDPATSEKANQTVQASLYYTKENSGLIQEWHGNVWCNPPYGKAIPYAVTGRYAGGGSTVVKSLQVQFVEKALEEYRLGHATQIILLVTANTTVRWFQSLWDFPMCTPHGKIGFDVEGMTAKQRQVFGNVFVYLGSNEQRFIEVFSELGVITKRVYPQENAA